VTRFTNGLDVEYFYCELERQTDKAIGKRGRYYHLSSDGQRWIRGWYPNMYGGIPTETWLYPFNLKPILCVEKYKYSQLKEIAQFRPINAIHYLEAFTKHPQLEYLVKLKLLRLAFEVAKDKDILALLDTSQIEIKKYLKLSGQYFDYAVSKDIDGEGLELLQYLHEQKINLSEHKLIEFIKLNRFWNVHFDKHIDVIAGVGIVPLFNYATKIKLEKDREFFDDYSDYYMWLKRLRYNLTDTMYVKPHNFRDAHDRLMVEYQEHQDKKELAKLKEYCRAIKKLYSKYSVLKYEKAGFVIMVPEKAEELKAEGRNLNNCVGTYIPRVASGETIVLFLRKQCEMNQSFAALELNPVNWRVVQCRTFKDKSIMNDKDVKAFLDKWLKSVVKKAAPELDKVLKVA